MATAVASATSPANDVLKLTNVLEKSRSPYVRGHRNNPVAWQMWGPEAIELAKKHNRLIFISIGYAACHWCHVMERESFDNEEVAKVLNGSFIPIKIDREERPDIDRIYMQYVQATTGHGGWPMSVFLTPDLEPVFGGTYWPGPESTTVMGGAHLGFLGILEKIRALWKEDPQRCLKSAKSVTDQLREFAQDGNRGADGTSGDGEPLDLELLDEALQHYKSRFDKQNGGFGTAPKFPTPANLAFLFHLGKLPEPAQDVVGAEDCENAKNMAVATLRSMTRGGIHDVVGNGFARYSVTADWSLPHFEKMLYDQGQLLSVYLDAFLVTGEAEMLGAAYDIATYLTTPPMSAPEGGFFSSEDADSYYRSGDSEKREGAFYVWTQKEFASVLGERDAEICGAFYNVKTSGNVAPEHDAHDELLNQNVLAISSSPEALAKKFGLSNEEVVKILKDGRAKLLAHRNETRPRPALDDKIVVGWNGLAIGALARASSVFKSIPGSEQAQECANAAVKATAFIKRELFDESTGQMKRVFRGGPGDAPAFADDYAYLIQGLIELYEATFDDQYLRFADTLQKTQIKLFHDPNHDGFFSSLSTQTDTLLRLKDGLDGAEPSTNGVTATNLYRLGSILDDSTYTALARNTVDAFAIEAVQHPFLFTSMMPAIVAGRLGMRGVVVTGTGREVDDAIVRSRLRLKPNTTVARLDPQGEKSRWLRERNSLLKAMDPNRPGVQVCADGVCKEELGPGDAEAALRPASADD